jgi:hypothetical protein
MDAIANGKAQKKKPRIRLATAFPLVFGGRGGKGGAAGAADAGSADANATPHRVQTLLESGFWAPQSGQRIAVSPASKPLSKMRCATGLVIVSVAQSQRIRRAAVAKAICQSHNSRL